MVKNWRLLTTASSKVNTSTGICVQNEICHSMTTQSRKSSQTAWKDIFKRPLHSNYKQYNNETSCAYWLQTKFRKKPNTMLLSWTEPDISMCKVDKSDRENGPEPQTGNPTLSCQYTNRVTMVGTVNKTNKQITFGISIDNLPVYDELNTSRYLSKTCKLALRDERLDQLIWHDHDEQNLSNSSLQKFA